MSVKVFGAKGDGKTDDTMAFKRALEKIREGAIEIPAGRYVITDRLEITRPNIVLRGEGSGNSVLYFPKPLNEIKPNWGATTSGLRTSNYSWSGGFITLHGSFRSTRLAEITSGEKRGTQQVQVASAARLKVGQEVELYQTDTPKNSLAIHLYSGDAGKVNNLKGRTRMSLVTRITKIAGTTVEFDRPLRCDLRPEWKPVVRAFEPTVTDSGIEGLGFEFPLTPYRGHFTELGYNPIAAPPLTQCAARDALASTSGRAGDLASGGTYKMVEENSLPPQERSKTKRHRTLNNVRVWKGGRLRNTLHVVLSALCAAPDAFHAISYPVTLKNQRPRLRLRPHTADHVMRKLTAPCRHSPRAGRLS